MLKYLGAAGADSAFGQAVSVSAPIDMAHTSRLLQRWRNKAFQAYLLRKQRAEVMRETADLSKDEIATRKDVDTIWALDDRFTAHRYGCDGAQEYYARNFAIHSLDDVHTPTLILHAEDDPAVENEIFRQRAWTADGPLFPALARSGGHTGFYARNCRRWHEDAAVQFFDRIAPRR